MSVFKQIILVGMVIFGLPQWALSQCPTFDALATCSDGSVEAAVGDYFIKVDNISATDFDLSAAGMTADESDGTTIYLGPFTHTGTGTGVITVTLTDNASGSCSSSSIVVSELVCGYEVDNSGSSNGTNDVSLHASGPACDCSADPPTGLILAQSAPGSFDPSTTTMVYVLSDNADIIIASNNSGLFQNLGSGSFKVYAYNVLNTDLAGFAVTVGNNISAVDANTGCHMACTDPATYTLDCLCPCGITNVVAVPSCNADGTYCVDVNFDVESPLSSNYVLQVDGIMYGPFAYAVGTSQSVSNLCNAAWIGDGEVGIAVEVMDQLSAGPMDGSPALLISAALPNPTGSDTDNETVTVLNNSCTAVDISNFEIQDDNATIHVFGAFTTLAPGASIVVNLTGNPLRNSGEVLELLDGGGNTINTLSYTSSTEGLEVTNTFTASDCSAAGEMCMGASTFDEGTCLSPSITISKYDANLDDLDGVQGDDTQTVTQGDDAVFEIMIENSGTEPLCNITFTDLATGGVVVPSACMPSFSFIDTDNGTVAPGSGDGMLGVGEIETFSCTIPGASAMYTNEITVNAEGCTSGNGTNDTDNTVVEVVNAPAICGILIEGSTTTCNPNGTYDLDICFTHSMELTPTVTIEVDGNVVAENVMTTGLSQCITIPQAGTGDGSSNVSFTVREEFIATTGSIGISEFHYDNDGTDTDEGVEIYGLANTNLAGYQLVLYNGSGGSVYNTIDLTGMIDDEGAGCGAVFFAIDGIQNGPDAIALVDPSGSVIEFFSYEGTFLANVGPANGMTSMNIGVFEPGTGSGTSIQLTDAAWTLSNTRTYGTMNAGLSCPNRDIVTNCNDVSQYDAPICDVECGTLACNNNVRVSLGKDCEQCITADMVLEGDHDYYEIYTITVMDADGNALGDCVNSSHVGQDLTIKVSCGNNSCWGKLTVEDKLAPEIVNCEYIQSLLPTSLSCADLDENWDVTLDLPDPVIVECNDDYTLREEQGLEGEMCTNDYRWVKRYMVDYNTPHNGNTSTIACEISIPIAPISVADINCPKDQFFDCDDQYAPDQIFRAYSRDTTDAFALTQAYPYVINTFGDTIMLNGEHCNILSTYRDQEIPICGSRKKVIRKWTFVDWCTSEIVHCDQIIKLEDGADLICTAPPEFEVPLGAHCIIDSFIVQQPILLLAPCTDIVDIQLGYKAKADSREELLTTEFIFDGVIFNNDGTFTVPPTETPFDSIWLKFVITDDCGSQTECFTEAIIVDDTPPTPVCNPDIAVSLNLLERDDDGLSKIYASSFDAGSHDNSCGEVYTKIIRMEELNNSEDGYWNDGTPDYTKAPSPNFFGQCGGANGDDFGDVTTTDGAIIRTGDQIWFDDHMKLCCTDNDFLVVMRVFDVDPGPGPVDPRRMHHSPTQIEGTNEVIDNDLFGRFNDCMITLTVQDKTIVQGACVPLSLNCEEYPDSRAHAMENAPLINTLCADSRVVLTYQDSVNINDCGNGLVLRDWYATVDRGEPVRVCIQPITLSAVAFDPYSIKWPKAYTDRVETGKHLYNDEDGLCIDSTYQVPMGGSLDCSENIPLCEPVWDKEACNLIGLSAKDDTLFVDGDACMKIIRTWSVIDWCIYNENGTTDDHFDDDTFEAVKDDCEDNCDADNIYLRYTNVDQDGYYSYAQVLKIVDDQAPLIAGGCGQGGTQGITDGCRAPLKLSRTATDGTGCGQTYLKWIAIVQDTTGRTLGTYPGVTENGEAFEVETRAMGPDEYNVIWLVEDACGNETRCEERWTLRDEKAPTPICVTDLSTVLMPSTGSVEIWASDYDLKSEDNCTRQPIASFSSDSIRLSREITCEDMDGFAAKTFTFKVWLYDDGGNADYCFVTLRVDDTNGVCGGTGEGGSAIIQGSVSTEVGDMVSDAEVNLMTSHPNYPYSMMTENNGEFAFNNNPMDFDYEISVGKDGDDINGVSTLDLVLIQKHILGLSSLDSPYKVIAADANGDQRVSAVDLVTIRKLILGIYDEFPTNDSWKFVDADYQFSSTNNPWPFTEYINIVDLDHDMMAQDYIGVKVGDVNNNAKANALMSTEVRSNGTLTFVIDEATVAQGDEIKVAVKADNFTDIFGYQMTLAHEGLSLLDIEANGIDISGENIGVLSNMTTMSWHADEAHNVSDVLFTLTFEAEETVQLSDVLSINSRKTEAEAYIGESLELYKVSLEVRDIATGAIATGGFELHQNQPNPFVNSTIVSFVLPVEGAATLRLLDVTGKLILELNDTYPAGYNEINLGREDIHVDGVIYYQLSSGIHTATKKMIIIE